MARIRFSDDGAALLVERLRNGLGDGWTVLAAPQIEGAGEVVAVVLGERQGAAVVVALDRGVEASPAEAAAAFRHMLDALGVTRALGGYLPVVGLAIDPERARDPAGALRRAFLAEPPIGVRTRWTQRVAALFEAEPPPTARGAAEPLVLHIDREDAWRVSREEKPATPVGAALAPEEHVVAAGTGREGGALSWTGMALAVIVLAALLGGMAMLSYGNGPGAPSSAQLR
jgi:hypothetical protein